MSKSRMLTAALIVCLVALAAIAAYQFGGFTGVSGMTYPDADKYTAGGTTLTDAVDALDIDWTEGLVKVEYHAGSGVAVSEAASRELSDDDRLRWWLDGTTLRIRYAKSGLRMSFNLNKKLTVSLPEGTVLKSALVGSTSADLDINGLAADNITLGTTSGNIVASTDTRNLKASSTSGDMTLRQEAGLDSADLGSTSGSIGCTLRSVKMVSGGSTSGSVSLAVSGGADSVDLGSTSGAVSLEALSVGKANLHTTSGSIRISAGAFTEITADSTSGGISAKLPSDPGFACTFSTASGSFSTGLAMAKDGNTYTVGDGKAKLSLGTTSGDISIAEYK